MAELVREDGEEEQQAREQRERATASVRGEAQSEPVVEHPGQEHDEQDQRRVESDVDATEGHHADGPSEHADDGTGASRDRRVSSALVVVALAGSGRAPPSGLGVGAGTSGSGAVPKGPVETQSITVEPSTASCPARGTWRMTSPGATAGLASS
jgi:hypothetical protein